VFFALVGVAVLYENLRMWSLPPSEERESPKLTDEEKSYLMPKDPQEVFKQAYNDT
jgi:hypothetical protein